MGRQLEARIAIISNAKRHLPHRNYGKPVDLGKIRSNLTLTASTQDSVELVHYCGIGTSIRQRIDEQREAKAMTAQTLRMRTERLRDSNERAAKVCEHQFIDGINPMTSRYF